VKGDEMFRVLQIYDEVRVPPTKFDLDINDAIKESLQEQIEGKLQPELGMFLAIMEIVSVGEGKILPEDGAIFYPTEYKVLTLKPETNEVVIGEVVDITEFGAFARIGAIDALIHVSQVMDDKVTYDQKNATFSGKKTNYKLKEGDLVRARVVSISLGKGKTKVAITMRQPYLGALDWIEKEKIKARKKEKKK
jgi:DNA-directed RNA polymerase subunit E'